MQKSLSELVFIAEDELQQLIDREPLLVTKNGQPQFVAQSLHAFEQMVRRLRQLEATTESAKTRGKVLFLRR